MEVKMNIEKNILDIKSIAQKWDTSGGVTIYRGGEFICKEFFGYSNRDTKDLINEESTYLISGASRFLLALSMLLLSDMKKISLNDTIDKYIPEYKYAHKIKVKHLLQGEAGLRDYFYGNIMPKLNEEKEHNLLDEKERMIKEKKLLTRGCSFEEVLQIIDNEDLEYEPGSEKGGYSETDTIFCKEIIERVSGMKLIDFEINYIFKPLNMLQTTIGNHANTKNYCTIRNTELLETQIDETAIDLFTTTFADIEKLMLAIYECKLLLSKTWKKAMTFNEENIGIGFSLVNGTACCSDFTFLGYQISLYFNKEADLCYMHLTNSEIIIENVNGSWMHFRKDLRDTIDALFTYPKNTRIVPYNKRNWFDALNLQISKEQYEFVCDAKQTIAYAFAYKSDHKLYVEMEGDRPVGLMVLQANKKTQEFYFSILLVDKRYQGRGFGKIMLKWGVEYFKQQGAKELTIGVNRHNISAQRLYKSVGFKEDLVYEEGMQLKLKL